MVRKVPPHSPLKVLIYLFEGNILLVIEDIVVLFSQLAFNLTPQSLPSPVLVTYSVRCLDGTSGRVRVMVLGPLALSGQ